MPRIRSIKPEFPQSESVGKLSRDSRLFFIQLWTLADDLGRLRAHSRILASLLYPYDDLNPKLIEQWITELEREKCVRRYEVDGAHYLEICNWLTHQKIDHPSGSRLPEFREDSRKLENDSETLAPDPRIGSEERNGIGWEPREASRAPQLAPLIELPLNDKSEYPVFEDFVKEMAGLYPAVDVLQQLRGMRGWLLAHPEKLKTKRGIKGFINHWLAEEQNQGHSSRRRNGKADLDELYGK